MICEELQGGKAESIQDALMFGASEKGMISLHVNKNDYLLDNQFASDMVHIIRVYESKIVRYERDYDKYPPHFLKNSNTILFVLKTYRQALPQIYSKVHF